MPLRTRLQLHPCERLEEQTVKLWHVDSCGVDEGVMATADAADFAFVRNRQSQGDRQSVIYTVAASTGVDKGLDVLFSKIGPGARLRP